LRMANSAAVENVTIEFSGTRLFLIDISLGAVSATPKSLLHRIDLQCASSPSRKPETPAAMTFVGAPLPILASLPIIGPPLGGKRWVALNGCCAPSPAHRGTGLPVNGAIWFAQRFAIDWMQLDEQGQFVRGDAADVHNYTSYGAQVLAVADSTVVDMLNTLDDQKPGTLPDPKTITIENVDGNHIVLDLGNGVYALYAHMQKGSVAVAVGDRVKRGQVLGKLGNTGNTSAPHLHFHLMEGASVLGSNGIPYEIDSFAFAGQVSEADFAASTTIEGNWSKGLSSAVSPRHKEFPLNLNIVDLSVTK
ncbi:MAG TPA: M23 family metallopeptidase, partial [Candidatus Angelobacter sp.]|nr:M23 family metallopeptidase [Candidatus Angelobacter sp.]